MILNKIQGFIELVHYHNIAEVYIVPNAPQRGGGIKCKVKLMGKKMQGWGKKIQGGQKKLRGKKRKKGREKEKIKEKSFKQQ